MTIRCALTLILSIVFYQSTATAQGSAPSWISEGPFVVEEEFSLSVPLESRATKVYVEVTIEDRPLRFVLDTGSPSMIASSVADELGLPLVDTNIGRDSHGAEIRTNIVQTDLELGGVEFQNVPLFAADFSKAKAAQCFVGEGVLGSEILPLCAWQIDVPNSTLRCNTRLDELDHVEKAKKLSLYDFGYPHAPFLDVVFAKDAKSKAMFDTGSPSHFTISPPDFEGAKKSRAITDVQSGYGSLGASLGGQAPNGDQVRGKLKSLEIGDLKIGRMNTVMRESPPSLIGASFLDHFVVTLDFRSSAAYLDKYSDEVFTKPSFGFSLGFEEQIFVSLVWKDSKAERAGLRVGQRITSINGVATDLSCEGMLRAIEAMNGEKIELAWDGGSAALSN
ncbi:MAG: aspartyl protease family protein [Pseudomonadota bacterium]